MTENEKTRRALVDQLANIIADYNARELSDTEWEGLNGEELECLLECLQFAQYKDVAIQALKEIQQHRAIGTMEEFKALKEKNEPKKAIFDNKDELCICPCCGKKVGEHQNYCWSCGQAFYT